MSPNIGDFLNDKNQDMPKDGELMDEFCYRVSDLGFPISEEGMNMCQKLDEEQLKQDQNKKNICTYIIIIGMSLGFLSALRIS